MDLSSLSVSPKKKNTNASQSIWWGLQHRIVLWHHQAMTRRGRWICNETWHSFGWFQMIGYHGAIPNHPFQTNTSCMENSFFWLGETFYSMFLWGELKLSGNHFQQISRDLWLVQKLERPLFWEVLCRFLWLSAIRTCACRCCCCGVVVILQCCSCCCCSCTYHYIILYDSLSDDDTTWKLMMMIFKWCKHDDDDVFSLQGTNM